MLRFIIKRRWGLTAALAFSVAVTAILGIFIVAGVIAFGVFVIIVEGYIDWRVGRRRVSCIMLHLATGDFQLALCHLRVMLAGHKRTDTLTMYWRYQLANAAGEVGLRWILWGDAEEATRKYEEALLNLRQLADGPYATQGIPSLLVYKCLRHSLPRHEALAAVEQAVAAYRRLLALAVPDFHASSLAISLCIQHRELSKLGRHDEALAPVEEAIAILRTLLAARLPTAKPNDPDLGLPDQFQARDPNDLHLPYLAEALHDQHLALRELGRFKEAVGPIEEAVAVYRRLAEADPEKFRLAFLEERVVCERATRRASA